MVQYNLFSPAPNALAAALLILIINPPFCFISGIKSSTFAYIHLPVALLVIFKIVPAAAVLCRQ